MNVWPPLLCALGSLATAWGIMLGAFYVLASRERNPAALRDALSLVPDATRLLRRVATDRYAPRAVRWGLWALLAYLLMPVDLIPDFIPLLGVADDVIVVALALRLVARTSDGLMEGHWSGTEQGLALVRRIVGTTPSPLKGSS